MKEFVLVFIVGLLVTLVHSYDSRAKYACEGRFLNLDCPRSKRVNILSANFGRTSKTLCPRRNQTFDEVPNCISTKAKKIIYSKCHRKNFCSVKASSAELGGDPCPGVLKYIDVIFKCVRLVPYRKITTTQSLPTPQKTTTVSTTEQELPTTHPIVISTTEQELPTTHPIVNISDGKIFDGNSIKPNETNVKASSKDPDHGFFHSMLVLLVLLKDKPKHSLLSVMTGVAAGAVMVLITVLSCVCVDKRRQKNESACFNDEGEAVELEKSELLERNKGSNSESAKTDDQVDSAFCDEELDRRVSNDYETTSDLAYLDQYLDEYNKNRSLPRPPVAGNDRRDSGSQRMSRRAHNDGSKGRSYDYNSNNENSFTTFS